MDHRTLNRKRLQGGKVNESSNQNSTSSDCVFQGRAVFGERSTNIISKSIVSKAAPRPSLKDSVKLKRAHMKARFTTRAKESKKSAQMKTSGKSTSKENIVNGNMRNLSTGSRASSAKFLTNLERPSAVAKPENEHAMQPEKVRESPHHKLYYSEILEYLLCSESKHDPEDYFYKSLFSTKTRSSYIGWLIAVHQRFELSLQTYFLAVNLFDRYSSQNRVKRDELRLLLCGCLLVASKYEEILYNDLKDYQIITNYEFDQKDLLDMEANVLASVDFNVKQTCHMSIFEIIRAFYGLEHSFSVLCHYVAIIGSTDSKLTFQDSAIYSLSVCLFVTNWCFPGVRPVEIKEFMVKSRACLQEDLRKVVLEFADKDFSALDKIIGKGIEFNLLKKLEARLRA